MSPSLVRIALVGMRGVTMPKELDHVECTDNAADLGCSEGTGSVVCPLPTDQSCGRHRHAAAGKGFHIWARSWISYIETARLKYSTRGQG